MAEPKQKQTRAGRGHRYYQTKKTKISLTLCPKCKNLKPAHKICPVCGLYKGKVLIEPESVKRKSAKGK